MRVLRWILLAATSLVAAMPTPAGANGGAYLELQGEHGDTYFVPGGTGTARTTLAIPRKGQDLLERGPFFVYIGPRALSEGSPLPAGTIKVGTASIERKDSGTFVVRAPFSVPRIEPGSYTLSLCNEPCTIAGFREPLTGYLEVAATASEASLLVERDELAARVWGLERELKKAEGSNEELEELQLQLWQTQQDNVWLADELNATRAERALVERRAVADATGRPLIGTWEAAAVAVSLLLVTAMLALRRRPTASPVPDTIEGLERERPVAR